MPAVPAMWRAQQSRRLQVAYCRDINTDFPGEFVWDWLADVNAMLMQNDSNVPVDPSWDPQEHWSHFAST
jgi:hypothetical protein